MVTLTVTVPQSALYPVYSLEVGSGYASGPTMTLLLEFSLYPTDKIL
jgi:hypothetical protein